MTALLYYSITSKLTDDEIKEIDKQISKNREIVKSLPSNLKLKVKKVSANGMLVFQLSQPLLYTGLLPLPPSVERLLPIEQDKILSDKKYGAEAKKLFADAQAMLENWMENDLVQPKVDVCKPAGEWNLCVIKIDHNSNQGSASLNGQVVVEFPLHGEDWDKLVANSKFKNWEGFGKYKTGHIGLQDHGDKVWYRNIKIKKL